MDWIEIGRTFGVPVMVLGAMMFGIYNLSKWIGKEVVIPFRDMIINRVAIILDKVEKSMDTIDENMERYSNVLCNLEVASKNTSVVINEAISILKVDIQEVKIKVDYLSKNGCPVLAAPDNKRGVETTTIQATPSTPSNPSGITATVNNPGHPLPSHKRGPKS